MLSFQHVYPPFHFQVILSLFLFSSLFVPPRRILRVWKIIRYLQVYVYKGSHARWR